MTRPSAGPSATTVTETIEGYNVTAVYHGGAYIDLCFGEKAFEVINVWDYVHDRATIPNTRQAVRAALLSWRQDAGDSLKHDLANYRESVR